MASYRELKIWQKSFILVKEMYSLTKKLPVSERYGLTNQIQRCAVSIPSNIAEGQQRSSNKEFKQFISIARGSAAELSTQLQLVKELYQIDTNRLVEEVEQIQKMLYSLQKNAL